MRLRRRETLLSFGMLCVAAAILLKRFAGDMPVVAFVEGMLVGIGIVLTIFYLATRPRPER